MTEWASNFRRSEVMVSSTGGEEGEGGLPPPFPGMTRCVKVEGDPFLIYRSMEEFLSERLGFLFTSPLKPMGSWKEVNEPEQGCSIFTLKREEIFHRFEPLIVFNEGEFVKEEGYKEEYYEYNSSTYEEYHGYDDDNNGDDCYEEDCGCWRFLDHYKYKPGDDICTFLQPCPFLQPY